MDEYKIAEAVLEELEVLYEFQKEGEATEDEVNKQQQKAIDAIDELELKSTLNEPEDKLNTILDINSGAGGHGKL